MDEQPSLELRQPSSRSSIFVLRRSVRTSTSCVTKILFRLRLLKIGQKIGIEAHRIAVWSSRLEKMKIGGAYQLGSKAG